MDRAPGRMDIYRRGYMSMHPGFLDASKEKMADETGGCGHDASRIVLRYDLAEVWEVPRRSLSKHVDRARADVWVGFHRSDLHRVESALFLARPRQLRWNKRKCRRRTQERSGSGKVQTPPHM